MSQPTLLPTTFKSFNGIFKETTLHNISATLPHTIISKDLNVTTINEETTVNYNTSHNFGLLTDDVTANAAITYDISVSTESLQNITLETLKEVSKEDNITFSYAEAIFAESLQNITTETLKEVSTEENVTFSYAEAIFAESFQNITTETLQDISTEDFLKGISDPVLIIVAICTFTIGIVGTVGNLLAVVSLLSSTRLRARPSTYFIVSLPLSLLPVCLIGMPYYGIIAIQVLWYNSVLMCKKTSMAIAVTCFVFSEVHLHTICALALNRTLAVCQPNFYRRVMSSRTKVFSYLTLVWIYSILVWVPLACLGFLEVNERELMVSWKSDDKNRLMRGLHVLCSLIFPIIFTTVCYSIMFHKVRSRNIIDNNSVKRPLEHHVTKTITVIFVVLVICSVPHLVIHALHVYQRRIHTWLLLHVLFWVQFCIDPFIYVACSSEYRQACLQFLSRIFPNLECLKKKLSVVTYEAANNREPTVTLPVRSRKTSVVFVNRESLKSINSLKSSNRQTSQDNNKILARQASQEIGKRLQRQRSQGSNTSISRQISQESKKGYTHQTSQDSNTSLTWQSSQESNKRFKRQTSQGSNKSNNSFKHQSTIQETTECPE